MVAMRAKGTGTYGKSNKLWRLQHKGIQATTKQLEALYGVKFTEAEPARLKAQSAPYWRRYLQEQEEQLQHAQKDASPLQGRIRSLERILAELTRDNAPDDTVEQFRDMLQTATTCPPENPDDFADIPALHPSVEPLARLILGRNYDPVELHALARLRPVPATTPAPLEITIATEARHALEVHHKRTGNHAHFYFSKQTLDLLCET